MKLETTVPYATCHNLNNQIAIFSITKGRQLYPEKTKACENNVYYRKSPNRGPCPNRGPSPFLEKNRLIE